MDFCWRREKTTIIASLQASPCPIFEAPSVFKTAAATCSPPNDVCLLDDPVLWFVSNSGRQSELALRTSIRDRACIVGGVKESVIWSFSRQVRPPPPPPEESDDDERDGHEFRARRAAPRSPSICAPLARSRPSSGRQSPVRRSVGRPRFGYLSSALLLFVLRWRNNLMYFGLR